MKAVILAGGKGTRLAPYTTILPKPLMPIGDMPILEVMLRQMKRAGINHVVLTVGHLASLMRSYFGDGAQWEMDITYSQEQIPLGTAGPIALVQGLNKTFLVTNGDVLTTLDIKKLVARMGLKAELYLPPKGRPQYFDDIGREKFREVFPGRSHVSDEDIIFYRTLASYNPALILISEVKNGEIYQFDTDAIGNWRMAAKFTYRRIRTS